MDNHTNENNSIYYDVTFQLKANELQHVYLPSITISVTISILCLIGVIGNILVIYVSATTGRIINRPINSLLVINLAVGDIVYLITTAPYHILTTLLPGWLYGSFMCPLIHFLLNLTTIASIYTMLALAIMRFLGLVIAFAISGRFSDNQTGYFVISVVWILSIVLSIPAACFYRVHSRFADALECVWKGNVKDDSFKHYTVALFVLTFLLPLVLVVIIYSVVIKVIKRMSQEDKCSSLNENSSSLEEYRKSIRLIFFLVLGFVICWLPFYLHEILEIFHQTLGNSFTPAFIALEYIGICTSYAHACINPIIYTFAAPGFRVSIREFYHRFLWRCRHTSRSQRRPSNQRSTEQYRYSLDSTRMYSATAQEPTNNLTTNLTNVGNQKMNSLIVSEQSGLVQSTTL